jgi:DNA-binding NarL/FixJ family response regulator
MVRTGDRALDGESMSTVMIVEDHSIVAAGVSDLLQKAGFEVVAICGSWDDAAIRYAALLPDVVLLDLHVPPDGNGLHLLPLLKRINSRVCVVCLSAATEPSEVLAALEAGVSGFISKIADAEELPPLIELALMGETAIDKRTVTRLIKANRRKQENVDAIALSDRELEVLEMIAEGSSNHEIALVLGVSRTSISDALTRAYRKLGARDRASATRIAFELGIVTPRSKSDSSMIQPSLFA